MNNILQCVQGSPEWLDARLSIPTSSCFSKILTSKGVLSASWFGYMNQLLAEYADPKYKGKRFNSKAMQRGIIMEPVARERYQALTKNIVTEVGGIFFDDNRDTMCSPDGLIYSKKRGWEVKCPDLDTHIGYFRKQVLPTKYILQVQAGLAFSDFLECGPFESWDFQSFHPEYYDFIINVKRDEGLIKKIKETILGFIVELNKEKLIIDEYKASKEF